MAQVLQNFRRQLARAKASDGDEESEDQFDPVEADQQASNEQMRRRVLERFRKTDVNSQALQDQVKKQLKAEAEKKVREFAARSSLRIFNIACSATLVLIIVTYMVWTAQFFIGNKLGAPWMPKLSGLEIFLWGVLSFILASVIIIAVVLIVVMARIMAIDLMFIGQLIWDGLGKLIGV